MYTAPILHTTIVQVHRRPLCIVLDAVVYTQQCCQVSCRPSLRFYVNSNTVPCFPNLRTRRSCTAPLTLSDTGTMGPLYLSSFALPARCTSPRMESHDDQVTFQARALEDNVGFVSTMVLCYCKYFWKRFRSGGRRRRSSLADDCKRHLWNL